MKKQFYRVKQLADQTFNRGEKSEILNHEELQIADQKIEYLRNALLAINKKITPTYPSGDTEKHMKKTLEYQIGSTFLEESKTQQECLLFQTILKESGVVEQQLARDYVDYESKVEELVYNPFHQVLENELPNILKLKHNLRKYCLDKDSASNRYHATGKETIKEDLEEADTKVEQSRDSLATEMFNVLAKENEFSEYILQFLKLQRIYHESALKNLQNLIPQLEKKIGDSPVRKVFGTSLQEHLRITGKRIAYPLEICITALSEDGMSEEGLFRVAASTTKVKRLKSSIDSGCFSYLIPEYKDVHVLASLLKLYLRELPEPLFTFHLHKDWIDAAQVPEIHRLEMVKDIISRLPQENKDNLAYLFQFLSKLTKHKENKMNPSNIAIVLSPNLLWNKHENLNVNIGNCVTINILVELLVREVEVLFPEDASKYVTISDIFHYDDYGFKTSNTNLAFCAESPRPNMRKKKAPVPPPITLNKSQSSLVEISPNSKNRQVEKLQTSVDVKIQTGELKSSDNPNKLSSTKDQVIPQPVSKSELIQVIQKPPVQSKPEQMQLLQKPPVASSNKPEVQVQKPPVAVAVAVSAKPDLISMPQKSPVTKTNRETMTENFNNMNKVQPVAAQNRVTDQKFTTTAVHKINQPVIYDKNDKNKTRNNSDNTEETLLRRKDPSMKPEVPARPSSLSVRPSNDIDPMLRRTQCSVYNVANKQQPSIINIQSNQKEVFQPGHDTQMAEKEKFLGHKPLDGGNKDNNVANMNLNVNCPTDVRTRSYSDANKLVCTERDVVDTKKLKSNEELNKSVGSGDQLICDNNGNQKSSHTRARSDGGVIDLEKGQSLGFHASRTLSKPTEPPPPPPEKM